MYKEQCLVRKGCLVKTGKYGDLHNFAVETFNDDSWEILDLDEFNYFRQHPEEVRKHRGLMSCIAFNARNSKSIMEFMNRPMRKMKRGWM